MTPEQELNDSLKDCIPQLSIDCVIFGFHDRQLRVLLSKFEGVDLWALQGGFIRQDEDIDQAAQRILVERTRLESIYLEQFYTFGRANRQTFSMEKVLSERFSVDLSKISFLHHRFVSIGYYALVDFSRVNPSAGEYFEKSAWFDIQELPDLILDHREIIFKALEVLRLSLDYQLVGFNLMPETFTMNELQQLYETILGQKLLRANFQRKMLEMNILERLEKKVTGKAHKAPYLYRFV